MRERKRILVWGKTYPEFSKTYYETVCTGGVLEDTGQLIRIYPITMRYLETDFRTYQWIEAEIEKNTRDPRPESFKINQASIVAGEPIAVDKRRYEGWAERRRWVLRPENVFASPTALRERERQDKTSLGLVKPKRVKRISARWKSDHERDEWEHQRELALQQRDLFVDAEEKARDLAFVPLKYYIEFTADDGAGGESDHEMSVLDWGLYVLHRRQFAKHMGETGGDTKEAGRRAQADVTAKIRGMIEGAETDPYFFLGNTAAHPTSFMIVGIFSPPKPPAQRQGSLF